MPPLQAGADERARWNRVGLLALAIALCLPFGVFWASTQSAAASSVRLLMVEEPGCRYCVKWHAEIGRGYRRTDEGRFAPLMRIRRGAPELKGLAPVVYTPTFILTRSGEELGRVTGYPGADYFYDELRVLLSAAGFLPRFGAREARTPS